MYEIFIPKSKSLQKHIHNFCILKEFDGSINYLAFPQLGTSIALYVHSDIKINKNNIAITKINEPKTQMLLLGKYKLPLQLGYSRFIPEISINFTATGLNYFFKENTSELTKNAAQVVHIPKWQKITDQLFGLKEEEDIIEALEIFLLDNITEKDLSTVESCISLLISNPNFAISEMATSLNISVRTINRRFNNYVGCSPTDFKKVIRFRKAIDTKFNNPFQNLTRISYESNFYDSPHFTREFKKLTRLTPRQFFSKTIPVTDKNFPYNFL